jgi:hypothetical protein
MVKYMKYGTQMENVYVEDVKVSQEVKLTFYYYHWVDTSAGGLLITAGTGSIPLLVDY